MTTRIVNVTVETTKADGSVPITAANHAGATAGSLSVSYDDTVITTKGQLQAAFQAALVQALGNANLK